MVGGSSERCLKWGGGGWGHKKFFVGGGGTESTTTPAPQKILTVHNPMGCIRIPLSQFLKN